MGQYSAHKSANQTFEITGLEMNGGIQCMIEAQHAKDIGFGVNSSESGAKVVTKPTLGTDKSKWILEYHDDDGSYSFRNKYSGKHLDLESDSDDSDVLLVQKDNETWKPSQRWFLEPATSTNDKMTSYASYTSYGAFLDTVTDNRYKNKMQLRPKQGYSDERYAEQRPVDRADDQLQLRCKQ